MVLWKRVVSYRRCALPSGSGSEGRVAIFLREKEGRTVRGLAGLLGREGEVLRLWFLLFACIQPFYNEP